MALPKFSLAAQKIWIAQIWGDCSLPRPPPPPGPYAYATHGRSCRKFPGATEHVKRQSCFSRRSIPNGNCVPFLQNHLWYQFEAFWSFFGKWNWFVQMVHATPGRNLPILNFCIHLPKPWTDRFTLVCYTAVFSVVTLVVYPCKWWKIINYHLSGALRFT